MAHELEFRNGNASMVYAGEVPWHGLGKRILPDLTPEQTLKEANLDWSVYKVPAYVNIAGKEVETGKSALVRDVDNSILDIVSDEWVPMQNSDAFDFFHDFVMAGEMEMHTAGSLKNGQLVWALAKTKEGFSVFGEDSVESYLLFTNPHVFGKSIDVRFTNVRVVCNNTLTMAISEQSKKIVKVSHRREFDAEAVKQTMGIAREKLAIYKETAEFLGSKRYDNESVTEYFKKVFPLTGSGARGKELSKNAGIALNILEQQPGAEYAAGSWWQAFNAITFMNSHVLGRTADTRVTSMWYGQGADLNQRAIKLAVDYAEAA